MKNEINVGLVGVHFMGRAHNNADLKVIPLKVARSLLGTAAVLAVSLSGAAAADLSWQRKSSTTGDLPAPNAGNQQTCLVVADFDNHKAPRVDVLLNRKVSTSSLPAAIEGA